MKLTHYTSKIETITQILEHGFGWFPKRRELIDLLIPSHDFSKREPQQFGMISFTELLPHQAGNHRKIFGEFGVVVSNNWAFANSIQKVIYIDDKGPVFESLKSLFQYAYNDLIRNSQLREGEVSSMAFTNKARAAIAGGVLYSNLLQLYEYLEPIESSEQQEWRIVHPHPYYGYKDSKEENIKNISPPQGWAKLLNVLPIQQKEVLGFVCLESKKDFFVNALPSVFKQKIIFQYDG